MSNLFHDLRFALRILRRSPGFTTIAIVTLTIAIGANLAIFAVVNAVLLNPLPFPQPRQLVRIYADVPGLNTRDIGTSVAEMNDLRETGLFSGTSAIWAIPVALTGGDTPQRVEGQAVGFDYFRLLGTSAELGRTLGPEDTQQGFAYFAVISDSFWRRNFGADPNVLGRKIRLDTDPYTIVGVMPPDFRHPGPTLQADVDVWIACGFVGDPFPAAPTRAQNYLPGTIARLKPGITPAQAQSRLVALALRLRAAYPAVYPPAARWTLRVEPLQQSLTGNVRLTLALLQVAVLFVLLIACVNIASLLLARGSGRAREFAIREALGAPRRRLIQQLLTESVLLAVAGTAGALFVLWILRRALVRAMPASLPRWSEVHLDWRVVAVAIVSALVTGVVFGLAPAIQISAVNPNRELKESGRGSAGRGQSRFRSALVAIEIAVSLMLLIGAGLLIRSFRQALAHPTGFNPDGLAIAQIWIPVPNNPAQNPYLQIPQRNAFVQAVVRNLNVVPGITLAAMASGNSLPFVGAHNSFPFNFADQPALAAGGPLAEFTTAGADFFRVMQIPLMQGRFFTDADATASRPVAIVNQAFVRQYSPGRDVTLRQIANGKNLPVTIVGVVGDVLDDGLDASVRPRIYFPILQRSPFALSVFLRTSLPTGALQASVTRAVHAVDPTLPVYGVRPIGSLMAESLARRRFVLSLMTAFAAFALLLAALGIYGVMAYAVTKRTREIGIRLALGANRGDILRLMLRPGLLLTSIGVVAGSLGAILLTRVMSSLLYGISPTDPATYGAVCGVLVLVALSACWIPAQRATRVKPLTALQAD